jgi:GNAT superfamily N-acetyltransferase
MKPQIRRAAAHDTETIVRILIDTKEASFPDTIDDHDRNVEFWTQRWRNYIVNGSQAQQSLGDGWVFLAELAGVPVGFAAYHHTRRHGADAELQNIYVLRDHQGKSIGTHLLGVVVARLCADGSRSLCVGYDSDSPYTRFYQKLGAQELSPGSPWAIWNDLNLLSARLPSPPDSLLMDLRKESKSWLEKLRRRK